ncbi:hypothetical protein EI94DRAFT_1701827 [Lactarius quietus]|nr:hypothetical protein EI94DRAFT_1701827 [Lactarius quietus]
MPQVKKVLGSMSCGVGMPVASKRGSLVRWGRDVSEVGRHVMHRDGYESRNDAMGEEGMINDNEGCPCMSCTAIIGEVIMLAGEVLVRSQCDCATEGVVKGSTSGVKLSRSQSPEPREVIKLSRIQHVHYYYFSTTTFRMCEFTSGKATPLAIEANIMQCQACGWVGGGGVGRGVGGMGWGDVLLSIVLGDGGYRPFTAGSVSNVHLRLLFPELDWSTSAKYVK